jgi:tRNA(Ser,Leu) C12 N-acetylase TAN1
MRDWNIVVTVREEGFRPAVRLLGPYGLVLKTEFFNTLVMRSADPLRVLDDLHRELADNPAIAGWISRFVPLQHRFTFQSVAEFEAKAKAAVDELLLRLANASFHLRIRRRGFKGKLSSMDEERFLDDYLLRRLVEAGTPGRIVFDDPDAIIALETVGTQAGLSLFDRGQLERYPLLHLD